jgi:hypothetical protein
MDDRGKAEREVAEQTPPKIKAEDNPWYLLATLYGVPGLRLLFRVKCGRYRALASSAACGHVSRHGNSLGSCTRRGAAWRQQPDPA